MNVEQELQEIKERNLRVEADKAWETSISRKILLAVVTYSVASAVFWVIGVSNFYLSAVIPTLGFLLSTLTLPFVKKWWVKRYFASISHKRP